MQLTSKNSFLYQSLRNCEIKNELTSCSTWDLERGIRGEVMIDKTILNLSAKINFYIKERLFALRNIRDYIDIKDMNIKEYDILLKEEPSIFSKDDTVEEFDFALLNYNCELELFSKIVQKVGSQILNAGDPSRRMTPLWVVMNFEKSPDILLKKIKLLLNFGANVNLANNSVSSPLNEALALNLPIAVIQLLILSGGVLYQPISSDSQEILNEAMQRFIEKAQVIQAVFKSTTALFRFLPLEIQALIFKATFTP